MNAIILAAGQGTRLRPLTDNHPKVMVPVAGTTILDRQLELFQSVGIRNVTIVTGYQADSIQSTVMDYHTCHNHQFRQTNMTYSLFCAEHYITGPTIISYGDILYKPSVLKALLQSEHDISVIVDTKWRSYYEVRFKNPFDDAESLLYDSEGRLKSIGRRQPRENEVTAQYIGLIKVSPEGANQWKALFNEIKLSNEPVGWGRPFQQSYMTDFIQELINRDYPVHVVPVQRGWYEIDNHVDHIIAEREIDF